MHTRINGISLSHRHRRRTNKRERKKNVRYSFVLSMNASRRNREREKKYLPDIHTLLYIYILFIVVGSAAILIGSSRSKHQLNAVIFSIPINLSFYLSTLYYTASLVSRCHRVNYNIKKRRRRQLLYFYFFLLLRLLCVK